MFSFPHCFACCSPCHSQSFVPLSVNILEQPCTLIITRWMLRPACMLLMRASSSRIDSLAPCCTLTAIALPFLATSARFGPHVLLVNSLCRYHLACVPSSNLLTNEPITTFLPNNSCSAPTAFSHHLATLTASISELTSLCATPCGILTSMSPLSTDYTVSGILDHIPEF